MLTVIAVIFSTAKWLDSRQSKQCKYEVRHHEVIVHHKKKRKSCKSYREEHKKRKRCSSMSVVRTPAIDDFVFVHKEPVVTNYNVVRERIGYPELAREAGINGSVIVRVLVDESGQYQKHKIISQAHPILGRKCELYVSDLEFSPAKRDGRNVKFWVNVPFHFQN
ncbi:MAG: energy transducer TonB [Bacteroidetes bacterium]|nr:energy transducer TonB [Bacteroidota bacterium]